MPSPIPPSPAIKWALGLCEKFNQAHLALGRLDSISVLLQDTSLFLNMYIHKEAVLSSQIEGTQSSLSDLLLFEMEQEPSVPLDDVQEVSNYVAALNHGLRHLTEGFPLSLRLLCEVHAVLLSKGRGSDKNQENFVLVKIGLVAPFLVMRYSFRHLPNRFRNAWEKWSIFCVIALRKRPRY